MSFTHKASNIPALSSRSRTAPMRGKQFIQRAQLPQGLPVATVGDRNIQPKQNKRKGIYVIGDLNVLPFPDSLSKVMTEQVNLDMASRIILINPYETLYNNVTKVLGDRDLVVILTKTPEVYNFVKACCVAVIVEDSLPGTACIRMRDGVSYFSKEIACTMAYMFLFNHNMVLSNLVSFDLEYICSPDIYNSCNNKPKYIESVKLTELVDSRVDNTIELEGSTLICACHFTTIKEIDDILKRCTKLMKAINHTNVVYVYSIGSTEKDSMKKYLDVISNKHVIFIEDTKNKALDAGKYLIGLNSIKNIESIYSMSNVITIFNDSVLMKDDLNCFAERYNNCMKSNDIIGAISSLEKSFHVQSWFISFNNFLALKDYMDMLSIIRVDVDNMQYSIIDQMEVGICSFLSVKYKVDAVYKLHNVLNMNVCGAVHPQAKMLRAALEQCGFPFVKKRLINTLKSIGSFSDLGINLGAYS